MYYIYDICNNVTVWHLRYGSNLIMYYGIYNMVTAIQAMHDEYNNVIPTILREIILLNAQCTYFICTLKLYNRYVSFLLCIMVYKTM
jgi:hypothetical protein